MRGMALFGTSLPNAATNSGEDSDSQVNYLYSSSFNFSIANHSQTEGN